MAHYDVLIIGGGAAGLSCAMTLGSAKANGAWAEKRKVLVIDDGKSDMLQAVFYNAAGIAPGTKGIDAYPAMKEQASAYDMVDCLEDKVTTLKRNGHGFTAETAEGKSISADKVVLATGFKKFDIETDLVELTENSNAPKPGRVQAAHQNQVITDNLYVAGLLDGGSSQFAIAAGSGAQAAITILSDWAGKKVVMHDKLKDV